MSFAAAQYRNAGVTTASPAKIVLQLHEGVLRFLRQAMDAQQAGDVATKGKALGRAHAIITELQASLNAAHAPDLCDELDRLYDFALHRVGQAVFKPDPSLVPPVVRIFEQLRGAWAELAEKQA